MFESSSAVHPADVAMLVGVHLRNSRTNVHRGSGHRLAEQRHDCVVAPRVLVGGAPNADDPRLPPRRLFHGDRGHPDVACSTGSKSPLSTAAASSRPSCSISGERFILTSPDVTGGGPSALA